MTTHVSNANASPEFLSGGGEMGQRIRDYDWANSPLGPVEKWPQSLRTCVRIMLTSRQPIWIGWGKDLIKLYNDPYKDIVRGKHPWALGSPASLVWKDIWREIDPMLRQVMEKDEGTYVESQLLIMERNGYPEETYYTFSYTPIPGDDGGTAGMICANTDDTDRITSGRQLQTLTELGKRLTNTKTPKEVFDKVIETLSENPFDFPFALCRTIVDNEAVLIKSTAVDVENLPKRIDLNDNSEIASLMRLALETREPQVFHNLIEKIGPLPSGAWSISPDKVVVLPIHQVSAREPYGVLVVALNPYRIFDDKYKSFFSLVADQIATSLANVYVLEEERKRALALAEIDKAKTTFFSNISHEFRTPLTLLLAPVEDALNDPAIDTENRVRMEIAHRNATRMQKLVNTLLEFSRIEAGRIEGRFSRIDLGAFIEELVSSFRSAVEKAGMQLIVERQEIHDEVYVDLDMWERIILNLVSNAFKYSQKGRIVVRVRQSGRHVEVAVSDTGIGIPADQLDRIFDRFYRIENAGGRSQEGTGIGLSMVRELVRLHDGTIEIASSPGVGSTFTIKMPVGKNHLPIDRISTNDQVSYEQRHTSAFIEEAQQWIDGTSNVTDQPPPLSHDNSTRSKVLLADDNADMRMYVRRLLADLFDVITANDGEDAFKKLLLHKPDLLLTDVMMPKMDGFALLAKVRSHPELKKTPVIFLSARAGEEAKVEGLDAGADDYIVKPFSAKELVVRVSNLIRINQVRRETERQFYQLFQQAPAIINIFKGPEFIYELYHPKNKEIFGDGDYTGMPLLAALPELAGQGIPEILSRVYYEGITHTESERPVRLHDGAGGSVMRYFNIIYQPWYDLKGKVKGVLNFAVEVTDHVEARKATEESEQRYRELNEQLEVIVKQRTEELQRSNDDLQQFAHVASHDLKEPVRKLRTFINRLDTEYADQIPRRGKEYLDKMRLASGRMYDMIEGVLKYSSFSTSPQPIEQVDLNEVLESIETDLELLIAQRHAVIRRGPLPVLEGAKILFYQLFYNLLNNSLKFCREDPVVSVSFEKVEHQGRDHAKIVISDNGIGFDPQFADKIFQAFARLHLKDRYEGTGLGLALCKKIVERHNGSITATGIENSGSAFTIILPFTQHEKGI